LEIDAVTAQAEELGVDLIETGRLRDSNAA